MGVHQRQAWEMLTDDEPEPEPEFVAPVIKRVQPENPCREHPNWERYECVHCGYRRRSAGVRREFMTQAERKEIFEKTGVKVESMSDTRRAYRQKGLREAERGEHVYEVMDALKDSAESGQKLEERHQGWTLNPFGIDHSQPEFNYRERYEYHKARLGK